MANSITFTVYGTPIAQGSMRGMKHRHSNQIIMLPTDKRLVPFRRAVTAAALQSMPCDVPMFGKQVPVALGVSFYFVRPKSAKRDLPSVAPDLDKCLRAIGDSLTGCVVRDDAQICQITASKLYGPVARVEITVSAI